MQEAFQRAFARPLFDSLGAVLQPYTLAHCFALSCLESPFALGGDQSTATLADLGLAVAVCRMTAPEVREFMGGTRELVGLDEWAAQSATMDWSAEGERFAEYLRHYRSIPDRWNKSNAAPAARVPWQWIAAARLCAGDASRIDAAWATPVNEAFVLFACDDAESVKSDSEISFLKGAS